MLGHLLSVSEGEAVSEEHRTELRERVEYRLNESYCIEPGCEYNGKPAVQGHCHTRLDTETDRYIDRIEKDAESILQHTREHNPGTAEYVEALESQFMCAWINVEFGIDNLVRLRRENAALKAELERRG